MSAGCSSEYGAIRFWVPVQGLNESAVCFELSAVYILGSGVVCIAELSAVFIYELKAVCIPELSAVYILGSGAVCIPELSAVCILEL